MDPEVRYFILADNVSASPNNLLRINIQGLVTHIRARGRAFPISHPLFYALLVVTNCSGSLDVSFRIVLNATNHVIHRIPARRMQFHGPLDEVTAALQAFRNCSFPTPGLYFVECVISGTVVARQPLTVTR